MSSTTAGGMRDLRYEPEEQPPPALALGLGFQFAMLTVAGIVLTPAIVVRAAGGSEDFLSWAAFAALAISGITTILQAVRVGRIGSGHVLLMGTSAAFIAVCVTALVEGGPGLLATLVTLSALFQFGLSTQLSLLRRVLTPTVCGTVIMLIPVTLMPIMFGMLGDVPEESSPAAAPATVAATLVVTVAVTLRATGVARLWAPVIGIASGCVVAGAFGLYNTQLIAQSSWIGLPAGGWPGFDLQFGVAFWSLLPAFIFVTLIGAIETIGDSVAIQRVSRRKPRATDYRVVQGAVTADGVGNLLSGLAATVPNTTYSSSVSVTDITGVASRTVGIYIGAIFLVLAFLPKFMGLILAIPGPVAGAYTIVIMSMLFVLGMRGGGRGRCRLSQGGGGGRRVLDRARFPERADLRRPVGRLERASGERDDRRRPRRNPHDVVPGTGPTAAAPPADRAEDGRLSGDRQVPHRVRQDARLGPDDDGPAPRGRRGDVAHAHPAGRGEAASGACRSAPAATAAPPSWSSSPPPRTRTSRTASPCSGTA